MSRLDGLSIGFEVWIGDGKVVEDKASALLDFDSGANVDWI